MEHWMGCSDMVGDFGLLRRPA